jgi:hypothetical protein
VRALRGIVDRTRAIEFDLAPRLQTRRGIGCRLPAKNRIEPGVPMIATRAASLSAAMLLSISASITAQQPSAWRQLTPPGAAAAGSLQLLAQSGRFGKLALYRDSQYMRVYSTVTGRWHAHTPSAGTTPRLYEDFVLVPESDRWTAISAYRGVFETLLVNQPNTTVDWGSSIAVVRHLGTVHVFSAFTGRWHSRPMPPNWNAQIGQRIATFGPNSNSSSFAGFALFDAMTGQWHDLPAAPSERVASGSISASTGILLLVRADQSQYLATWTGVQANWQFQPIAAQPPLFNLGGGGAGGCDFVTAWDITFSGLSGVVTTLGAAVSPANDGLIATAYDTTTGLYSCLGLRGVSWVPVPAGSIARYTSAAPRGVRLFANGNQTLAFDAGTDTLQATACDLGQFAERGYEGLNFAAAGDANGMPHIYSCAAGQWVPVPGNVLPESPPSPPTTTPTTALLRTTTGVTAFSGRTGAFVPLTGSGMTRTFDGHVVQGGLLHVFDERADRWLTTTDLPNRSANDSSGFVAAAGTTAVGYGARASRLESITLPEPALQFQALDGGGIVRTQNHLFAFSGLPDLYSFHAFPHQAEVSGPGSTWRHQVRLPNGVVAAFGIGPRLPGPVALPPFGALWFDPQQSAIQLLQVSAPGEERVEIVLPLPDIQALRGTEWVSQQMMLPFAGSPWLSDPATLTLR